MTLKTCLHITKYFLTSIYLTTLVFMLKSIATTHWIHYWNGTNTVHYGLWSVCSVDNGNQSTCTWMVSFNNISDDVIDVSVPVALIVNVISTFILFPYLLQVPYVFLKTTKDGRSFMIIVCTFASAIFGLAGLGRFTMKVVDSRRRGMMTFEMSYILASCCVYVETLLLPFTYWYAKTINTCVDDEENVEKLPKGV